MIKLFLAQFIIIILIILAVLGVIYGSFLPFKKAQSYVYAVNNLGSIRTIDELKKNFAKALDYYSPVGQEETTRFSAQTLVSIVGQENMPDAVSKEIVGFIEPYIFQDNAKQLLLIATMYETRWHKYGKDEDLKKTTEYMEKILNIAPKLPMSLYGLFSIYQQTGELEKAKSIGEKILQLWPEDERVKKIISE